MKLAILFKSTETHSSSSSSSSSLWPWAKCSHSKTHSFRAINNPDIFKTMNKVYINSTDPSYLPVSSKTDLVEKGDAEEQSLEMVIGGLISKRFFVETTGETSSILEEANKKKANGDVDLFNESVAIEMESRDPFVDFRISMEEMVIANHESLKDNLDFLKELLACYLRVNHRSNHGYIVGAFVDLLIGMEFTSSANTNSLSSSTFSDDLFCCSSSILGAGGVHSFTSPLSFYSSASSRSPCLSSLMESEYEIEKLEETDSKSTQLILYNV